MIENCSAFRGLGTRKTFQYGRWMKSSFARQCKKVGKSHYSYWEYSALGIFLKWLFPFLCSFRSIKLVNVYDHFSLWPTDRLLTGYWKVTNRSPTVGRQSAETLARNITKTVSADCWPSVSRQLANSRLTVSFKNCSSLLLKNIAGTL